MRLSVVAHPVVRHAPLHRVLVPTARLRNLLVRGPSPVTGVASVTGSRADLLRLGAFVRLAATSGHSALFVPARDNEPRDEWWQADRPPVDLLVVRHDVGLRPSGWPAVRRALRRSTARPGVMRTPPARVGEVWREWEWTGPHRLGLTEHAATLVVAGTGRSLHRLGDLLTEAGELLAADRDVHRHGHAHLTGMRRVFSDPEVSLDVYGLDPIFHKSRWAKAR
ncbi:MAG: hypothetical protein HOV94_13165 [Saccharothrix sp.]|nr:hypothetical protein [Saccharothrix sp.]